MKNSKTVLGALSALFLTTSCATIVSGGSPKILIDGNVAEPVTITTTKTTYENVMLPIQVKIRRKKIQGQRIHITSAKNKYKDIMLEKEVNPWVFGNLMIGGLIGFSVDLITNSVSQPVQTHYYVVPLPEEPKEE